MFDNKFLLTLLGLILTIIAIYKYDKNSSVTENWVGIQNVMPIVSQVGINEKTGDELSSTKRIVLPISSGGCSQTREDGFKEGYKSGPGAGPGFYSTESFQSNLAPRASSTSIKSATYNHLPPLEHQAVPQEPIEPFDFSEMVKENYGCNNNTTAENQKNLPPPGYTAGDFSEVAAPVPETSSLLPVGDLTHTGAGLGNDNTVVYNRMIFSTRKSRLRSQGDPIRGDLPIVPCNASWFKPSANADDLQQGAMTVMGGMNEASASMAQFQNSATLSTTIGGADIMEDGNPQVAQTLLNLNNVSDNMMTSNSVDSMEDGPFRSISTLMAP